MDKGRRGCAACMETTISVAQRIQADVFRVIESPETLRALVLQTRIHVEKAREIAGDLQSATERTLRRVEETERKILASDGVIHDCRSIFSCEPVAGV
jgi:hypothetical protein